MQDLHEGVWTVGRWAGTVEATKRDGERINNMMRCRVVRGPEEDPVVTEASYFMTEYGTDSVPTRMVREVEALNLERGELVAMQVRLRVSPKDETRAYLNHDALGIVRVNEAAAGNGVAAVRSVRSDAS